MTMIALEKQTALAEANSATLRQPIIPRWLKIPAAVAYSGISRRTLSELMNAGNIKSHRIGAARVLDRESLDAFISAPPSPLPRSPPSCAKNAHFPEPPTTGNAQLGNRKSRVLKEHPYQKQCGW